MIDLDAIKARLAAATPGPWAQHPEVPRSIVSTRHPDFSLLALDAPPDDRPYAVVDSEGDADFIVNAPTDIAALIAEVEALRSEALTMRQWAEEAAKAENANARDLVEARAEVARLRALLGLE